MDDRFFWPELWTVENIKNGKRSFSKNSHHVNTSQLTRFANQSTGFYMIQVLVKGIPEQTIFKTIISHKTLISEGVTSQWLLVVCSETHSCLSVFTPNARKCGPV